MEQLSEKFRKAQEVILAQRYEIDTLKGRIDRLHEHACMLQKCSQELKEKEAMIHRLENELQKVERQLRIPPLRLTPNLKAIASALKVLDSIQERRKAKSVGHHSLVRSVAQMMPVMYPELFRERFYADYKTEMFQVIGREENRREADIVIRRPHRSFKVIEVETRLPLDPFLRDIRKDSLKKEFNIFSMHVLPRNIAVVILEEDEELSKICKEAKVTCLPLNKMRDKLVSKQKRFLGRIAKQIGLNVKILE
ncbi:hypothetical protein GTO27_13565 [Candidatus Bathyarchaeota archaeon]|nr:hypothetical protein [Candidatus Bathyarchaeota archaeon]